jgi:hypothetical protein
MSSSSSQSVMETICQAYGEAIALYCRGRAVAQALMAQLEEGRTDSETLERLQRLLRSADRLRAGADPALASFGGNPPPPVQAVLEQATEIMQEILSCIHQAEARATQALEEMTPQLDVAARCQQMRRAYETR